MIKTFFGSYEDYLCEQSHAQAALINKISRLNQQKNEAHQALIKEQDRAKKSRLCLIAAKTPRLLLLDEVSNNLDQVSREHVVEVLKAYPGALVLISHDLPFMAALGIDEFIDLSGARS